MEQMYGCFSPTNCPWCKWYPRSNRGHWGKGEGRRDLIQQVNTINVGCDDSRHDLNSIFGKDKKGGIK